MNQEPRPKSIGIFWMVMTFIVLKLYLMYQERKNAKYAKDLV